MSPTLTTDRLTLSTASAMISGMTPELRDGRFYFCSTHEEDLAAAAYPHALGMFREDEGVTLVLSEAHATRLGFALSSPMSQIVLEVYSSLEGVGLTAAVAAALARDGIACNMIAAYHHDHVFVPSHSAQAALRSLHALQSDSSRNG